MATPISRLYDRYGSGTDFYGGRRRRCYWTCLVGLPVVRH